jgi:hypothetical protein
MAEDSASEAATAATVYFKNFADTRRTAVNFAR